MEYARPTKTDEEGGKELADQYEQALIAAWVCENYLN